MPIRLASLFAAIALTMMPLVPSTAAAVPARDQAAIRTYLTSLYTAYRANSEPPGWASALTAATRALVRRDEALNRGDESEALGADPICGCQDWNTIRVTAIRLTPAAGGRVTAVVSIVNFGPKVRTLIMQRTPAGWRVHDVLEGRGSLRLAVQEDLARLSRQGRR